MVEERVLPGLNSILFSKARYIFHREITLSGEFIFLIRMACVILPFTYLFSESRIDSQVREHRASGATQVFPAIAFGLLSVNGMSRGMTFYTARGR
jgi:hypothetical protein